MRDKRLVEGSLLGIVFFIWGCATAPIEPQSVSLPGVKEALAIDDEARSRESATRWVERFQSPTLDRLVAEGLQANIGLNAAEANAKAAEAAARISRSVQYPGATIGLNAARQQSRFSFLGFQKIETETYSLSLGSQWEVDLWRRLSKGAAAGEAEAEAARADVAALRLSLSGQIAKTWFNILEAEQQWRLALDSARSMQLKEATLERRYDKGLASSLDLRLARAQTAASRTVELQRKSGLDSLKRALETLLGRYPSAAMASKESLPEIDTQIPSGLPAALIARRPDLAAGERRFAASLARSEATARNWLPRISLTGSAGTTSDELTRLLNTDLSVWNLASELGASLFNAGRNKAEREQMRARAEVQLAQYRSAALKALEEIENALAYESELADLGMELARAARESKEAEALAWDYYERGLGELTVFLDAQRRSSESASQLLALRNQRLQNRVDLHVALGGDFE